MKMARDGLSALLILTLSLISTTVQSANPPPKSRLYSSFVKKIQGILSPPCCTYKLRITISDRAPPIIMDTIGIWFHDRFNNRVFLENINYPRGRLFKRRPEEELTVYGPCTYGVCELGLRQHGTSSWTPAVVEIFEPKYFRFPFGRRLPPNGEWAQVNYCPHGAHPQGYNLFNVSTVG